jgi:hypothetical protein
MINSSYRENNVGEGLNEGLESDPFKSKVITPGLPLLADLASYIAIRWQLASDELRNSQS